MPEAPGRARKEEQLWIILKARSHREIRHLMRQKRKSSSFSRKRSTSDAVTSC